MVFVRRLARRRAYVMLAHLTLAAGALPGLLELESGNPPPQFFPVDAPELAAQRRLEARFGDLDAVRVAVGGPGLWTPEGLAWLRELERRGQALPGALVGGGLFRRWRRPLGAWPPADPGSFRELAAADPLSRNLGWISADGQAVSAVLAVRNLSGRKLRRFCDGLDELLATAPAGVEVSTAGIPILGRALDRAVASFGMRFVPLVLVFALVLLAAALGRLAAALPCLLLAGFGEILLFGIMGHAGSPVTLASAILAPILLVLSVASGVHLQLRFRQHRAAGLAAEEAVVATYREKSWPVLATGLTTLVGFGSVAVSPVPVVRAFGLWAAAGVALVTVASFSLLPALLVAGGDSRAGGAFERLSQRLGRRVAAAASRRRRAVLAVFAVAAVGIGTGLLRAEPEAGLPSYFHSQHPVRVALAGMIALGVPPAAAELLVELPPATAATEGGLVEGFDSDAGYGRLAGLAEELRALPEVLTVVSAADVPAPGAAAIDPGLAGVVRSFLLSEDGRSARLSLGIPMLGLTQLDGLARAAAAASRRQLEGGAVSLAGRYPLVTAAQRSAYQTLLLALMLTLACVGAVFYGLVRSVRYGLTLLLPNLWAVIVVLGAIGWLGMPIGANTVLVGAVVLGLAVDDTLHFFGEFRRWRRQGGAAAVVATLERTAGAHLLSSLMLVAGFGLCTLAEFRPLADAGALVTIGVTGALVADLVLLPALLSGDGRSV